MTLSERLKTWRNYLKLTQEELADKSGVSKSAIQGYELGKRKPGSEALLSFIQLGLNAQWLLTGKGNMLTEEKTKRDEKIRQLTKLMEEGEIENPLKSWNQALQSLSFILKENALSDFSDLTKEQFNSFNESEKKLKKLHELLDSMELERRKKTIEEMLIRAEEVKRLEDLENFVLNLKETDNRQI